MLIDINAYTGHWPFRALRGTDLSALCDRMNAYGVDMSIVSNLNGIFYVDCQQANEELVDWMGKNEEFSRRIIPFAVINPALPWWREAIRTCAVDFGMKGIRIFPLYHHYKLTDSICIEMVQEAARLNLAVSIPLRMTDLRERSWMDVDKALSYNDIAGLVTRVPNAMYMILDARITDDQEATSAESIGILKKSDVLFDTSRGSGVPVKGPNSESLSYLVDNFGEDKLAFGSETPFVDYSSPFIRLALFSIDNTKKQKIWSGNVRRMLSLK